MAMEKGGGEAVRELHSGVVVEWRSGKVVESQSGVVVEWRSSNSVAVAGWRSSKVRLWWSGGDDIHAAKSRINKRK